MMLVAVADFLAGLGRKGTDRFEPSHATIGHQSLSTLNHAALTAPRRLIWPADPS